VGEEAASVNYEVAGGLYAFTRSQIAGEGSLDDDVFPGYVRTDSYAFLGDTPMRKGEVATFFSGDELTYHYPIEFLDKNKSLIYSSDGARVYR
jgi:hypothetical protein